MPSFPDSIPLSRQSVDPVEGGLYVCFVSMCVWGCVHVYVCVCVCVCVCVVCYGDSVQDITLKMFIAIFTSRLHTSSAASWS